VNATETIATRSGIELLVERRVDEQQVQLSLRTDENRRCLLHWGLTGAGAGGWQMPPKANWPEGTKPFDTQAVRTPFLAANGGGRIVITLPSGACYRAVEFVLFFPDEERWDNNDGRNYRIEISEGGRPLHALADEIIRAETSRNSWTLMHRFNLCHDLLDRVRGDVEGLALLFVWLRFSAVRQLTWQKNYNTKPRELSHAQDRLSQKLADVYRAEPDSRPLVRLMLGSVGRGGEGQKIRDEILNIMHRHHIKEVAGHFLEEWHQKLHNNTTPDDIVICEAYLDFLRSDGNLDRYYKQLQASGVTKERLASFERPIKSNPDFILHLKEGLIHDFQNFLNTLKSVHAGTDLETAIHSARHQVDAETQRLLSHLWHHRNDLHLLLVQLVERITEARRRLREPLSSRPGLRELLYLDLALEEFLRTAVERNIHLHLSGDQLVELTAHVLENLVLSETDAELTICSRHWQRLIGTARFGRDWSLHAKSVLDRVSRGLSGLIDRAYQLLQPKAELLGDAFHAEPWAITLFSEEVVRGSSLGFVLSMLLHHLDPLLRRSAQLGHWQIISRGRGSGQVEVVETLRSIQGKQFDQPTVIVADQVMGDEEVPQRIVAVIAPDVTDIVSHVAVRARNAHLLFAACYDAATFQNLKALNGCQLQLEVNAAGDVVWTEAAEEIHAAAAAVRPAPILTVRPQFTRYAVAASEFNERIVGSKSLNQVRLHERLADWVKQPASVALPFGVFEQVLSLDQNKAVAERHAALVRAAESDFATTLPRLRETTLALTAPRELVIALRETMQQASLPWPDSWEHAWLCIKRVWASKWNERAFLNRKANGIAHDDLFMAVLVQQVVEADYAFVIHTVNPVTGNPDELYSEVVLGLGETVVANHPGRALSFTWDKKSAKETLLSYPGKSVGLYGSGLIFRSDSNGEDLTGYAGAGLYDSVLLHEPRAVSLDYSQERLVWDADFRQELLSTIAQAGLAVAETVGSPQDVEGAWARGRCYVVQTRPQVGIEHA
jgi:alpha-glucan,water dikinase